MANFLSLVLLYLFSSLVQAGTYYEVQVRDDFLNQNLLVTSAADLAGISATSLIQSVGGTAYGENWNAGHTQCYHCGYTPSMHYLSVYTFARSGTCPSPLVEGGSGACINPPPTCPYGTMPDSTGTCVNPCPTVDRWVGSIWSPGLPKINNNGCVWVPDTCAGSASANYMECHITGKGTYDPEEQYGGGQQEVEPTTPEAECVARGQSYGYVNGVVVCVAIGTTGGAATTNTTDNAGTTTTNTVNTDGTVSTTTSETGGSDPGTSETQTYHSFCDQNPTSPICTSSGPNKDAGGGTDCSTPPICSGDAIQCHTLHLIWKNHCDWQKRSDITDVGEQSMAGNMPEGLNSTINLPQSLDSSSFLAGGCPGDMAISTPFGSIDLPLTPLCDYASKLGYVMVALASLLSARIVAGAT